MPDTLTATLTQTRPADRTSLFAPARRERAALVAGAAVGAAVLLAAARATQAGFLLPAMSRDAWLAVHLCSVIPALPLGAVVLLGRKGDARHRLLGRIWAVLMLVAALSSFGLKGLTGSFSPIHLLSILVLVSVPRGVVQAVRGNIVAHRRTMTFVYLGLVGAGAFTMLPGRLLGLALFH